ncbi:MAG: 3-phosphoserine/phosphohydroxythreonine transaminase [Fibrobacterota bacterium]
MSERIFNFSAGPATLPLEVLEEAKNDLLSYKGAGMSVMEMSHRSKDFDAIITEAEANFRKLLGISDDYAVLFLQGGASTQFAMIPMNLLGENETADYVDTGSWSAKAIKEAGLFGKVNIAGSSKENNYTMIPDGLSLTKEAAYTHITSNNTIAGTQYKSYPETKSPLIADMSSDILHKPVDVSKFGMIYAGAQKNLGPSGVTVVIIRKDLAEKTVRENPTMLKYSTHVSKGSMFNTPPCFPIYIVKLVTDWLIGLGGLNKMEEINKTKAEKLYTEIDGEFYKSPVREKDRSIMNVVWRLPSEDLEKEFIASALSEGLSGLKGHRSVGGIRASIYNSMPAQGIDKLTDFMKKFRSEKS